MEISPTENQIPLSSGLIPIVIIKTVQRKMLGQPYDECNNQSVAVDSYWAWDAKETRPYSQRNIGQMRLNRKSTSNSSKIEFIMH